MYMSLCEMAPLEFKASTSSLLSFVSNVGVVMVSAREPVLML